MAAGISVPGPNQAVYTNLVTGSSSSHGYPDSIFCVTIDDKYKCSICRLVLNNPIQSFCGHRYCRLCLSNLTESHPNEPCPACVREDAVAQYSSMCQTFPDKAMNRELNQLPARCQYERCPWTGLFKKYLIHVADCSFSLVICSCSYACKADKVEEHSRDHCPLTDVTCPFGCTDLIQRAKVAQHDVTAAAKHIHEMYYLVKGVEERASQHVTVNASSIERYTTRVTDLERQAVQLIRNVTEHARTSIQSNIQSGLGQRESEARLHLMQQTDDNLCRNIEGLLNTVDSNLSKVQKLQQSCDTDQGVISDCRHRVSSMERAMTLKEATLAELGHRIQALECCSHTGELVWRIPDWSQTLQNAKRGQPCSMYSSPFYSDQNGYKACCRLYPNGDGMGKGSHVSLFFVIMRGPYDGVLTWPFRRKVSMTLIDQVSSSHLIEAFRSDPSSSSFRRPTTDMNIASGCPMFMPQSALAGNNPYVRDDTMFLKIKIGDTDLPGL